MSATVLGIDQSLVCSGWVSLSADGTMQHGVVATGKGLKGAERLGWIESRVAEVKQLVGPLKLCTIEGYSMGSKGMAVFPLGELGGVLRLFFWKEGMPLLVVPPTQVKQFATRKGNSQKDEVRLGVYRQWGVEFKTTDECDAYVLARIGLAYLGEWEPEHQYQRELVAKLKEGAK